MSPHDDELQDVNEQGSPWMPPLHGRVLPRTRPGAGTPPGVYPVGGVECEADSSPCPSGPGPAGLRGEDRIVSAGDRSTVRSGPRDVREALPRSASIIEALRGGVDEAPSGGVVVETARDLAVSHRLQWEAEEASRAPGASDGAVAASKRRIDDLNARRVAVVERIDMWVEAEIPGTARASLHQLAELAQAYDDLVRDVAAGRRRLPRWRPLKSYPEQARR
jgi:hypothetical protein